METNRNRVVRLPGTKTLYAQTPCKLNVCGYARVSTLAEEQEDSFTKQCEYYTNLIQAHSDWNFAGIFADDGCTGTKVKARPNFQRMIQACKAGKINKIICKSVSRFARNTIDALQNIRELKELGISVYFESEGIDTLTPNGEVLLTILASMAEQESRNISHNVKWGLQRKFGRGEILLPTARFLGYTRDDKNNIIIDVQQAAVVQRIYKEFLVGKSSTRIAKELEAEGIKSPGGKDKWYSGVVRNILQNEKYTGNAIMGKTYKKDVLSPNRIKNEENDKYYIENSHPAIIDQDMFNQVQAEFERRRALRSSTQTGVGKYSSKYCFSGLLLCGECGSKLRRYAQGSGEKKQPLWVCVNHKITNGRKCAQKPIKEKDIEEAYLAVLQGLTEDIDGLLKDLNSNVLSVLNDDVVQNIEVLDEHIASIQHEAADLNKRFRNAEIDNTEYNSRIGELQASMTALQNKRTLHFLKKEQVKLTEQRIETMRMVLTKDNIIKCFDETIFRELVESIIVEDKSYRFKFKNGLEFNYRAGVN